MVSFLLLTELSVLNPAITMESMIVELQAIKEIQISRHMAIYSQN